MDTQKELLLNEENAKLKKLLLAQNRELEIESALEKVRSRSLAMHKSDELKEVVAIVFDKFRELNFQADGGAFIAIFNDKNKDIDYWTANPDWISASLFRVPDFDHPVANNIWAARNSGSDFLSKTFSYEQKNSWWDYLLKDTDLQNLPEDNKKMILESNSMTNAIALSKNSGVGVLTFLEKSFSEEETNIIKRFANVFEQAYTRFLDLQKAEAQARESQVQLVLERVRARTMAMHQSNELAETALLLFQQLEHLGLSFSRTGFYIWQKDTDLVEGWASNGALDGILPSLLLPFKEDKGHRGIYEASLKGELSYEQVLSGEELKKHYQWLMSQPTAPKTLRKVSESEYDLMQTQYKYAAIFKGGYLLVIALKPQPDAKDLLERFAKVFEQTYTRFLDLQKAEAQARESQIELALERVRARTMAMQKSEELKEVIQVVYDQFVHLNINVEHTGFILDYKERDDMFIWLADKHEVPSQVTIPYFDSPHWNSFVEAKATGKNFFANLLSFEEKNKFYQDLFKLFPVPDEAKKYYFACPGLAGSTVLLDNISLYIENFEGIPFTDEENDTLMRFGKVFQQTYTRFLDLQKAEAQAREAKIEAALERVRSRTMGMQHSNELAEAASLLFKQVSDFGINVWSSGFNIWQPDGVSCTINMCNPDGSIAAPYPLPHTEHIFFQKIYEARQKGEDFLVMETGGKELEETYQYMFSLPAVKKMLTGMEDTGSQIPKFQVNHCAFFSQGYLMFITYQPCPEMWDIFKRFAKVFEQTYTRFLDLQKSEAQARESQIQLAMERVRARTMAMQRSEELQDAASLMVQQIQTLGVPQFGSGFNIWDDDRKAATAWMCNVTTDNLPPPFKTSSSEDIFLDIHDAAQRGESLFVREQAGKELETHYKYMNSIPVFREYVERASPEGLSIPDFQIMHCAFFSQGYLMFITYEPVPEAHDIFKRFAKVFEQTYTRFLDLQKAEAQARESQIEASLERVRSKTMAMHSSNDVGDTVATMFNEFVRLGIQTNRCGILIFSDEPAAEVWTAKSNPDGKANLIIGKLDMTVHGLLHGIHKSWKNKETYYTYTMEGNDLKNYYQALNDLEYYPTKFDMETLPLKEFHSDFYFPEGSVFAFTAETIPDEASRVIKRFAAVFGQTYRRYLDLQKAEAQAREANIEAALERVRSRTMAMQNSDELADLVATVFKELNRLEFALTSCIIWINNPEFLTAEMWVASTEMNKPPEPYYIKPFRHPYFKSIIDAWKQKNKKWVYEMNGEEKKVFQQLFFDEVGSFPTLMKNALEAPESVIYSASFYNFGALEIIGTERVTDEKFEILHRLGKVFDMSYTRFTDLKQAEAQAREATIEAALERVRSRTLAMQKSDELTETSSILFRQLIHLGIAPNRLYIGITNDKNTDIEFWITDEDGSKVSTMFSGDAAKNISVMKMYNGWKRQKKSIVIDMHGKELDEYFHYLGDQLRVPFQGGLTQKRRIQYISYFSKGFIGMASPDEQPEKTVLLLGRFAAVFNLTFTRFNDLKVAEAHALQAAQDLIEIKAARKKAEETLVELQSTQKQLIQSEKMASLGELTAGIAHEIQNPLNFVNNFSEVNKEMLEELKAERLKPNAERDNKLEDELINDVIENSEKINHHGKRAGDIVKGMLQHSRSSSGVKEPTDINALADEYLRLAYHGLRAKDKAFNATMKTDYDETLQKVNIIPQDIGRVILNLITNAFYAVNEKAKLSANSRQLSATNYQPTVSVSTKKTDNHVIITVSDNGGGIPQNIANKIFQPFFTTKPTGQGTGLGLSLSYDIVKAHGGEIKVETLSPEAATQAGKEAEKTTFIIQLPI